MNRWCSVLKWLCVLAFLCVFGCVEETSLVEPKELMARGWASYRLGDYDQAQVYFDDAYGLGESNKSARAESAYALGMLWSLRRPGDDADLARTYFQDVTGHGGTTEFAPWSALALVRLDHLAAPGDEPDYPLLLSEYESVIERDAGHPAAQEAALYKASILVAQMTDNTARQALEEMNAFVRLNPESRYISAAYAIKAACCEQLNLPVERLAAEEAALQHLPKEEGNPFYDSSSKYWKLAVVAEFEAGDFDTARMYYQRIIEEYPQDIRVFGAQQAIDRMNQLEDSLLYDIQMEKGS
ncbi:MAG: tetratricopeptide repeat protein [Spartobacteria bacterium]|nr:tetratricopeptide repeat protein [Spartobacteria bacterium]